MVFFLPLILVLLAFGVLSGNSNIVVLLPVALMLGAGAVFINIAMRDGRPTTGRSVRRLPTGHLQRQMYMALRPNRPERRPGGDGE